MFVDKVRVKAVAGKGGNGIVAWNRLRYIPKGGPFGGNGGNGGSILVQVDDQLSSLGHYRNRRLLKAKNGGIGGTNCRRGKNGEDLVLKVPCGTLLKDQKTGEVLYDLSGPNDRVVLCRGGHGGRGNHSFKSPTNRAPNISTDGKPGTEQTIEMELKLIADVGFVGYPNAGKSTLFNALTQYSQERSEEMKFKRRLRVKTAPYPFTTLQPHLSFLENEDLDRIYLADIPGIIEGAHQNRGLGIEFLRHIERTKLLLLVLDASAVDGRDPCSDFSVLQNELKSYREEVTQKPTFIILNKVDCEESGARIATFLKEASFGSTKLFTVSALEGKGIPELYEALMGHFFPEPVVLDDPKEVI